MGILDWVGGVLSDFAGSLSSWLSTFWQYFKIVIDKIRSAFPKISSWFGTLFRHIGSFFKDLLTFRWKDAWLQIQAIYRQLKQVWQFYQKHILDPIQMAQQTIQDLYNKFWLPILKTIDSTRVFLHAVFFWNRKLAGKIDNALFGLESKLLKPITALWRRVNILSSTITALMTPRGLIDGTVFVSTAIRHAKEIRQALHTFPSGIVYPTFPDPEIAARKSIGDFQLFIKTGTGPMADIVLPAAERFRVLLRDLGANRG